MSKIDDLAVAVTAEDNMIDGAVALIQGLSAQVAAAGTDPAKLTALVADINAKTVALAAAVASGTLVAPPGTTQTMSVADATAAATAAVAA